MARKKQEVALQLEINTQEEWEELMQKEGLIIVDAFQDWCGPCKAVLSFFRRIKNEIGDDFLHFATAKCDTIDSLDKYRGRCEPCFLIYGGGSLVSVIRGANPPALEETIKAKLEEEHKVIKGEIERKEIKDPYLADMDVVEKVEKSEKEVEEIEQEVTLALIKPDVVKAGKAQEIISKIHERGIEILAQQERNLTEEEAKSFYHHMESSEFFENLVKFLISGPSFILVLAKGDEGVIHEFRELIGPKVFEDAKETAPESFRAVYGTNSIENAIHGADDKESVQRELAFFFPDFIVPKIARKKQEVSHQQRTLALIRPAAFAEFKDSILEKIRNSGFQISMQKEVKLNKEEAELFYKEHKGRPYFDELTTEMAKGTLLALALEKQNAISGFRGILGPKDVEKAKENDPSSLRAQFFKEDININLIHGSDSEETAQNELKYFFPVEQTVAAIKPDGIENREEIISMIKEARFNIAKTLDLVMSKELAEEFYADQKEEEYFEELIAHMESGPTLFMILSREDAVRGWRSMMGPKDPNIAAESYPDSIRSVYGKDVKENAVYGSADASEAFRVMTLIFGKLEFLEDGSLLEDVEITQTDEVIEGEEGEQELVKSTEGEEGEQELVKSAEGEEGEQELVKSAEDDQQNDDPGEVKTEGEEDTSTKEDAVRQSSEPEVAESTTIEEEQEKVIVEGEGAEISESPKEENKETAEEETKEITSEHAEEPSEDNTEKIDGTLEISGENNEIIEAQGTEEDVSQSQQENTIDQDEANIVDNKDDETLKEDEKVEESTEEKIEEHTDDKVEEDKMDEPTDDKMKESTEEKLDEHEDNTLDEHTEDKLDVETSERAEDVSAGDEPVVSTQQQEETVVEHTVASKDSEDVGKVEETAVSEEHEENTVVEETMVSKESENEMKENEPVDDTVAEESEKETKSEDIKAENEPAQDNAGVDTAQPDDTDNAATAPDAES